MLLHSGSLDEVRSPRRPASRGRRPPTGCTTSPAGSTPTARWRSGPSPPRWAAETRAPTRTSWWRSPTRW